MRVIDPTTRMKGYVASVEDGSTVSPLPRVRANADAWRNALPALGVAIVGLLAWYASTVTGLVEIWMHSVTFTHGFVVPPIALWLIWRQREVLARTMPRPAFAWFGVFAAAGFAWLFGQLAVVNAVTQFAFVTMLISVVPIVLGTDVARRIAFPLGFLYFAVPFGEFLLPKLMQWTADFTVAALQFSAVPVYREGLQFVIPSGRWSIVEACSGIRYLIASAMVGTLYAYLSYSTLSRRLAFVGVSLAVPIVANWLRAYMIVMIGHLSNNRFAVGVDHLLYGWIFFGIVMFLMFAIGARWREAPAAAETQDTLPIATRSGPAGNHYWKAGVLVLLVSAAFPAIHWRTEQAVATGPVNLPTIEVPGWTMTAGGFTNWKPHYVNPSAEVHATFRKERRTVGLYVGYYRNQRSDSKLVSSENVLALSHDDQWRTVAEGTGSFRIGGSGPLKVHFEELGGLGERRLIAVKSYWVNGTWTGSDYVAKLSSTLARIQGHGDDGAVVIVYAEKGQALTQDSTIDSFLDDAGTAISAALQRAKEAR